MRIGKSRTPIAVKCRSAISLAGEVPAVGKDLLKPLKKEDNCVIVCENGRISSTSFGRSPLLPGNCEIIDLGDSCLLPPVINAHCHLQLSWLQNQLRLGQGFGAWLASLVAKLLDKLNSGLQDFRLDQELLTALNKGCQMLIECGTALVADIGASIPGSLTAVGNAGKKYDLDLLNFCEWFGFGNDPLLTWPSRCANEIPELKKGDMLKCAPCAHALYSTEPGAFAHAKKYCQKHNRPFTFHLAESEAETEMLCAGRGEIYDLYAQTVLPKDWQPPGLRPYAYARKLGLIDAGTLAVHAVQLNSEEISDLAQNGAKICLCPRSNANIDVGQSKIGAMLQKNVMLCLGTDGLTSNTDLNVLNEAIFLLDKLPKDALVRLLTVNGAHCLGQNPAAFQLRTGNQARFALLPKELC